jgi:hypothetical protein
MLPLFTPELKFGLPCLAAALSCYDANSRFDAANALFGPLSIQQHWPRRNGTAKSALIQDL